MLSECCAHPPHPLAQVWPGRGEPVLGSSSPCTWLLLPAPRPKLPGPFPGVHSVWPEYSRQREKKAIYKMRQQGFMSSVLFPERIL